MSATLIAIVTLIYVLTALTFWLEGRPGLAITFIGYSAANIGLIIEAMK